MTPPKKMSDERSAPDIMKKIEKTARRAVLAALTAYAAVCETVLLISGRLLPTAFAEYMALSYQLAERGYALLSVLFSLLLAISIVSCAFLCLLRGRRIVIRIAAAVCAAADLLLHSYVFFAYNGFQWSFLISLLLDAAILVCVLFPSGKDQRDEGGKEKGEE